MKVLITGGAGFIGSHLTERLLGDGHEVCVLDDLSTGRLANLAGVGEHPKLQFVRETVRNESVVNLLVQQADVVYHLAAAVGVQLIVDRPVHTIETNIHGSEVVLAAANRFCRPILIASTSEVYGKSTDVPFREDADTVMGATAFSRWSYACSKAIDEFLAMAYHRQHGLPAVIVRFFNTVGPRQTGQYGMVIPRFVRAALRGEPLTVFGTGTQSRCFADVSDILDGVLALMAAPAARGEVFNLGSTEEIGIHDLARRIIHRTGSRSPIVFKTYEEAYGQPFDDMARRMPCLDKAARTVGYTPKVTLDACLDRIIDYFRRQPEFA